jgi:outer membrane protein TolC
MRKKEKISKSLLLFSAFVCLGGAFVGCMTPEKAVQDTDETAIALATVYWREQTGTTNSFDISRPQDVLTLRLALEAVRQGITNTVFPKISGVDTLQPSNGITYISLTDALRIGARNNRKYQSMKEDVYRKAIELDTERYSFETTFSGFILGALSGVPEVNKLNGDAGVGAKRKFENGSTIAGNLAVDVLDMIRDDWHSFGLSGDMTVTIPLLRGSAREIVREPLTQAERNLAYSLLNFERYRQTYAISIIEGYYNVLEYAQNRRNSGDNARRLEQNWLRAEMMFKAGRMDRIQVDQARTDLLGARQSIITTQQSYENALDNFKITLGLAPEAPIALHDEELLKLEKEMESLAKNVKDALSAYPSENEAMNIALTERRDLAVTRGDVADRERALAVASDALRADVSLEGGGSFDEERRQHSSWGGTENTFARLRFTAPWDRRRERNAYRKSLIQLEQSRRTLEESEDTIKNQVRSGYRSLVAARALYENKVEAWKVAKIRVESNDLFMQSGRSSMRDILEAESALLSARNALCSSIIDWKMCDLSLKNSMGVFTVNSEGVWE